MPVTLNDDEAYHMFLLVDTVARVEKGCIPSTIHLRDLLLPTYREWHRANPHRAHPGLSISSPICGGDDAS
jgi:hypothetical protein